MLLSCFREKMPGQEEVVSFDMLIYPFDKYTWYFAIASSFAMLLSLATVQVLWCYFSGDQVKIGWMFQGTSILVSPLSGRKTDTVLMG